MKLLQYAINYLSDKKTQKTDSVLFGELVVKWVNLYLPKINAK